MAKTNGKARGTFERPPGSGVWWIRWACTESHLHRKQIGPQGLAKQEHGAHRKDVEKARRLGVTACPEEDRRKRREQLRSRPLTFEEAAQDFLAYSAAHKRSHKSDQTIFRRLHRSFAGKTLAEITPALVERYQAQRLEQVAPSTCNREVAALKCLFNRTIRDGKATENPVKAVKLLTENNTRTRYLLEEEEVGLFAALPDRFKSLVAVALHTGLRRGELLGLRWEDVDFHTDTLTVARSKHGEARRVPMNSRVRQILLDLRREQMIAARIRTQGEREILSAYVFCDRSGNRYAYLSAFFSRAVRAADLVNFRFHDLRHTFASRLAMAGVDTYTIKELLGHKTLDMVSRYAHLSPSHQRQAVDRLIQYESGTRGSTREEGQFVGRLQVPEIAGAPDRT